MAVSYDRLWKLLIDKKVKPAELRREADIAPNTMTKLRRDESVNLAILGRICGVLSCDYGDIMEYVEEPAQQRAE
ncbi:MAG: helix-turn-helix transcriptional regulator [Eubacterium sp.]|nr:helix-turn-helix transcriptional regulator [Eubacterium sp.]